MSRHPFRVSSSFVCRNLYYNNNKRWKTTATRRNTLGVLLFFVLVLVSVAFFSSSLSSVFSSFERMTTTNNNNEEEAQQKCAKILDHLRSMNESERERQTRLDLSECGLRAVPKEVLRLRNLEFLNLGKNKLNALPDSFAKDLPNLKILFCLANEFRKVPEVLGEMEHLFMLSFKANKVREIPEQSLPIASLGWLILSDNEIEVLPKSLGKCRKMRKLMLAGNKIKELPTFMSELVNLELLRASDNRIEVFPEFLYRLPKLAWLAFAANPCTEKAAANAMERGTRAVKRVVNFEDLGVDEGKKLGSGASGTVYRGEMDGFNVAIKVYNNMGKTSDGRPEDEMAAASLATSTTSDIVEGEQEEQRKPLVAAASSKRWRNSPPKTANAVS